MSTLESNSKFSLVSSGELQVCQSFILFRFQLHLCFQAPNYVSVFRLIPINRDDQDQDQMIEAI